MKQGWLLPQYHSAPCPQRSLYFPVTRSWRHSNDPQKNERNKKQKQGPPEIPPKQNQAAAERRGGGAWQENGRESSRVREADVGAVIDR